MKTMQDIIEDVCAFHEMTGLPVLTNPQMPGNDRVRLRMSLINEEAREFNEACNKGDIVGCADALADLIYVAIGAALEMGIPLGQVWDEVQRSNMAKRDPVTGQVKRRDDGKILKPDGWTAPDIKRVIEASGGGIEGYNGGFPPGTCPADGGLHAVTIDECGTGQEKCIKCHRVFI